MDILIPFVPTSAWLFATAISIAILLIVLMLYLFNYRRISQITDLGGSVADLVAKKELIESDYEAIRNHIIVQKEELLRIDGERKEQETLRLELDKLTRQVQAMDSQNQFLRDEVGQLELEKHRHDVLLRQITDEMRVVTHQGDAVAQDLKILEEEIPKRKQENAQELSRIDEEHKKVLAEKIQTIDEELLQKKEIIAERRQEFEILQEDLRAAKVQQQDMHEKVALAETRLQTLGAESVIRESYLAELNETLDSMRKQRSELGQEIEKFSIDKTEQRQAQEQLSTAKDTIANLEKKELILKTSCDRQVSMQEQLLRELDQKKTELAKIQKHLQNSAKEYNQLLQTESRRTEIERAINRLEIEENRLQEHISNLRKELNQEDTTTGTKNVIKSYSDLLVEPACLNTQEFSANGLQMDELQALQKFQDHLEKENIIFPERVIKSFHTSLKCADINPLTVLAGVSGTGKTLLPIKYARLMGMHSLVMAVQPRWDSPQDMFGFYNYLEKQYRATDLARALVRMDEYHPSEGLTGDSKNRMLLVLMDEMNLARTEYYFSEFLSKLELRRDVKDPLDPSDRERAEVVLDLGPGSTEASRLWVGDNILFVGTMNEDETTQSLSDKVLDRSNVLRFGKPANRLPNNPGPQSPEEKTGFLTHELWKGWVQEYNDQAFWSRNVADWTENINTALQKVGRPFGYRVEKAIRAYVANYPGVESRDVYRLAFADQIEQKILPKLRGLELSDRLTLECLGDMEIVIAQLGDTLLSDAFNEAKQSNNTNMFIWPGVSRS